MDATEQLRRLGFGEYESKAYVALLRHDGMNGYELARAAGVPRPNVYGVLQRLEDRGAVLRAETPAGARYSALPPEELLRQLDTQFQDALSGAGASLAGIRSDEEGDYVWNISGYSQAIHSARGLLESARQQALIAIRAPEAQALSTTLSKTGSEGIQLTILCLQGCPVECGHCGGRVHRYPVQIDEERRWMVMVVDGIEMLAAEIRPAGTTWAVRSRQPLLVDMASWYVQQTIAHSALLSDLKARRVTETLSVDTLALLESEGTGGAGSKFTHYMRRLVRPEATGSSSASASREDGE